MSRYIIEFGMPKLGLTMTEGTIEEWKKKEGDAVQAGDVLFSVATDKLTNDIEADTDGVLLKILVGEGETAECKAVVAYVGQAGETVLGGTATSPATAPAAETTPVPAAAASAAPAEAVRAAGERVLASPAAKKLAKEKGYDLSAIPGTGPSGRVTLEDVENFAAGPKASPVAAKLAAELGVDMLVVSRALTEFPDINASFKDNLLTRHPHEGPVYPVYPVIGLIGLSFRTVKYVLSLYRLFVHREVMNHSLQRRAILLKKSETHSAILLSSWTGLRFSLRIT